MTWLTRYRIRHYVSNSFWILPLASILPALVAAMLLHAIEEAADWESTLHPDTARAVLGTLASSMFTFIVFVCSALLVSVQLASAQLTPRIIGIVFRDPVTKLSTTLFVFAFAFTLAVMVRVDSLVYRFSATAAAYSCLLSLAVFLYLIDHVGRSLRPSGAVWSVARFGRDVIESVYPQRLAEATRALPSSADLLDDDLAVTICSPRDGVILAFDSAGLVSLAQRTECVIEMVPQVGDFVAADDPLFRISRANVPSAALSQSVAIGQERTLEQDPAFVFRILVDIASKGLSPAINDPTTVVLAIDQIHHLLRNVGSRFLGDGRVRDSAGHLRLLYRTPNWDDFVYLAVTEIRHFGSESIQVARRLRAMLEDLLRTLPEERHPLLRQELNLLHRSAERSFSEPEDRELAGVSDLQGVGGKSAKNQSRGSLDDGRKGIEVTLQ
ncbi:MAG TPA: DUF2254 domain-containing protein [Planctomycetaceae bacterium]|jgi:uncharacterized membrane protein|nr:DUF2254 domain-containing protein [Planctomycetaceae bacterium]